MATRKACRQCPFRQTSPLPYDEQGIEALDDGHTPSCHKIVGANLQFNDIAPGDEQICIGYVNYCNGVSGFEKPRSTP